MQHQKTTLENQSSGKRNLDFAARPDSPASRSAVRTLALQRLIDNQGVERLIQLKPKAGALSLSHAGPGIQRFPANHGSASQMTIAPTATAAESNQAVEAPARPLIAEDDAKQLQPGQMRKSEFLDQLHSSVCGAAEEELAGTMWSAMGCPYIDRWFSHYSGQSGQYIERALRRYAPETAGASGARDYIPIITERVRRGIGQWKETGEVTGAPEELAQGGAPVVTAAGLMGGLVSGTLSAVGGAISGLVSGAGRALSGVGQMLFKGRGGGARDAEDPVAIQSQLDSGHSFGGAVKARMEKAYGRSFSGVRIHTDAKANELSDRLNARAFTVGGDIAFGTGEYQPGTPIGDALIAHELAHVVQQGSGASVAPMQKGKGEYDSLEEDADMSAVGAVASIWGGAIGALGDFGVNAAPRLRSGLRLQGCSGAQKVNEQKVKLTGNWEKDVKTAKDTKNEDMMVALAQQAVGSGIKINKAGNSSTGEVKAEDYKEASKDAPVVNFDINLHEKKRGKKVIGENPGYSFSLGTTKVVEGKKSTDWKKYAIIGPNSLKETSPLITRMYAEHELYHVEHHLEKERAGRDDDEELETWTMDFINYFHQFLSIPKNRPTFAPLLGYYAKATADAKKASLAKLKRYYDAPPTSNPEQVKKAISLWVDKWKDREGESKVLIDDLSKFVELYKE